MERHGFIHDMLDVKVLLLNVMTQVQYPVGVQKIYELALQDECLSYFDVAEALPQMVETGHLSCENNLYSITDKGMETEKLTNASLAYPVRQRVKAAVERFNRECRRDDYVHIQAIEKPDGQYTVVMGLDDDMGNLMTLEMSAPSRKQAIVLSNAFREKSELIYHMVVMQLLDTEDSHNEEE